MILRFNALTGALQTQITNLMKILGLTGDIASGKSTVGRLLGERGAAHLDADLQVRELYADGEFAAQLAARFGDIRGESGAVDRAKLAPFVFDNPEKLRELESLVHPAVAQLRARQIAELARQGREVVVVEAVKLLESGQGAGCDALWCVFAAPDVQLARLMKNRGLSEADARARLSNQPSRADKEKLAGCAPLTWIDNSGSPAELERTVAREWKRFKLTA